MAQTNYINSLSSSDCTDYLNKLVLSTAITTEDLQAHKNICPEAAIFTSINTAADSDTDTASESGCELPEPLTAMFDPSARDLSTADLQEKCKKIYEKMAMHN
ncbi:unnamed protein product [Arctogadus glacialis]